jgi:predicted alpha/beta superfamily hydrolase
VSYGIHRGAAALLVLATGCAPTPSPAFKEGAKSPDFSTVRDAGAPDLAPAPSPSNDAAPAGVDAAPAPTSGPATIRVHYPVGTHTLALRGDAAPLTWTKGVALTAMGNDTFVYTVANPTARVEFKPLLDDTTWAHGANYAVTPGATVDVYPHFFATQGKVINLFPPTFHSNKLNNDRIVWAYLPPSYDENTDATYPVLYMDDGQNLFDPQRAFGGNEWKVDETLDFAAEADGPSGGGQIREIIVVGPEATAGRIYEYTPTPDTSTPGGGGGDLYLSFLTDELKPAVDKMLRTQPGRTTTGTLGSSLGGLISAYASVTRADVFGIIGAMSPSTWWNSTVIIGDVQKMQASPRPLRVYVDSGDSGTSMDDVTDTNKLAATYLAIGYQDGVDFKHIVQAGGQHNEIYWSQRLPGALAFLFGPR